MLLPSLKKIATAGMSEHPDPIQTEWNKLASELSGPEFNELRKIQQLLADISFYERAEALHRILYIIYFDMC